MGRGIDDFDEKDTDGTRELGWWDDERSTYRRTDGAHVHERIGRWIGPSRPSHVGMNTCTSVWMDGWMDGNVRKA